MRTRTRIILLIALTAALVSSLAVSRPAPSSVVVTTESSAVGENWESLV